MYCKSVIFVLYIMIYCKTDQGLLFLSCISWSSYHKNLLASSDYEGTVILWDGFTGQRSKVYQVTHNQRATFPVPCTALGEQH